MTPVVLVHGVGLDQHMWAPLQALLPIATRAYDLIGLGSAPKPDRPYSLEMYARQLAAEAKGEPIDVVGFSLGSLIAQRFAVDFPHLVRRLVLVSGVFDRTPEESAAILSRVAQVRAGGYDATIEPAIARWFTQAFALRHPDVVDAVRQRMYANDPLTYSHAYAVFAEGDREMVDLVSKITAPTLVVTGEADERSTPEMARRLAAAIPGARFALVPKAKHLLPLENPAALATLVHEFLSQSET